MVVRVPLADVRAEPSTSPAPQIHDDLQETQLLYGERVHLLRSRDGWAYVEALEQPEFTHQQRWQGYPGWVPQAALARWKPQALPTIVVTEPWALAWQDPHLRRPASLRFPMGTHLHAFDIAGERWRVTLADGSIVWLRAQAATALTALEALPTEARRHAIVQSAQRFLGDPYYWGGRSPSTGAPERQLTGVDCSGLVNLAYRSVGIEIPRDAHEQSLRAHPVATLQPADLIFLSAKDAPQRIVHVMLYAGDGQVIEGPGTGLSVRRIAVAERLGVPVEQLRSGAVIDGQTVTFGTYVQ